MRKFSFIACQSVLVIYLFMIIMFLSVTVQQLKNKLPMEAKLLVKVPWLMQKILVMRSFTSIL